MRRAGLTATAVFGVCVVAFAVLAGGHWYTQKREFPSAITSPPALLSIALDTVRPGQRLCMGQITIEPHAHTARFQAGTYHEPGPPLTVELTGPRYRVHRAIPGGYADNAIQAISVPAPSVPELIQVCIANHGKTKIALYSAGDRARSRATVEVAHKGLTATPAFGFWEAGRQSIASRTALSVRRIALFRGPLGYDWVVWAVLVLALLALTIGLGAALWRGFYLASGSRSASSSSAAP